MSLPNMSLPPDLEAFVQAKVGNGEFSSQEAVVQAAIRLLQERDQRIRDLRREIDPALAELDQGLGQPLDMQGIKAEVARRLGQGS
jgi:putative addiction module CopG family antidote